MITIVESNDNEYIQVARAIYKFNMDHLPVNSSNNMTSLNFAIKDDRKVVGGAFGKILLGNCLSVEVLWVDPLYRNKDYGTQLMLKLEDAARKLGSRLSIVDTFDFQARDFYIKLGYIEFGALEDCPCPGNIRYYLKKVLV